MIFSHLLSLVIFSPLAGLVPLLLIPSHRDRWMKGTAFVFSLIPFLLSCLLFQRFQGSGDFEFSEVLPWIPALNVYYRVGVDGFSLPLVLLTTLLVPIVLLSAWDEIEVKVKGFLGLFFVLEGAVVGVFAATDLFLFYLFWEAMLIPMYFLIGIWGGPRRLYAAIKFVLYTMFGSLLMLAAILYLYQVSGHSTDLAELSLLSLPEKSQWFLFLAFALAFAVKVPLFPFHTWLPDAHVEAPTAGSVILAGVLLKMGVYGFIRFAMPFFPQATTAFLPLLIALSVIGIIYGSLVAMVQTDLKKLIAYTSVSHLGFVVLGLCALTPQGVAGASLQMINHGISTGGLFLLVGMVYHRRHSRLIADFGGLATSMPIFTTIFLIVSLSSIALPGTNGFVGEFLILLGSFKGHPVATSLAVTGVVLGAAVLLWMIARVFFGPVKPENASLTDLSAREVLLMSPILLSIFVIGLAPGLLLNKMVGSVERFLERMVP